MEDIRSFHYRFYKIPDKITQDNFILKYTKVSHIKRVRNEHSNRPRTLAPSYSVQKGTSTIPVCKDAFLDILNLKRYRVEGVLSRFFKNQLMPAENRGGDHRSTKLFDIRENIIKFIKSFTVIEKHYCRGKSERQYIASDLSIVKMWKIYSKTFPDKQCKLSFFRKLFNTKFNIGFNAPQVDVCSYCLEYKEKLKREQDLTAKKALSTELKVHKLRAKAYFNLLREGKNDLITLSYDCEKNLVLPKIPDQITYYKRQLYLYNFSVVVGHSKSKLSKDNVFIHTWLESESSKGSNEIASAVYDTLNKIEIPKTVSEVRLMSDGCAGQNKNSTMIGMCAKWLLEAPAHINNVQLVFPVTGHSFIPPDRVFGIIEKTIKKKDTIIDVNEYYDIFETVGTVKKLGHDWNVLDWKDELKQVLKPTSSFHFKINSCKRVLLSRTKSSNILVRGEPNYRCDINNPQGICKKGARISYINPNQLELNTVNINPKKAKNVNELLCKHFGDDWLDKAEYLSLEYYKQVVTKFGLEHDENESSEEDVNDVCEGLSDTAIIP